MNAAGGRALLVGGWVREFIRSGGQVAGTDYDIECYGLAAGRLKELLATLGRVDAVGEASSDVRPGASIGEMQVDNRSGEFERFDRP